MPFYTNDEIRVLKRAFDLACDDLGLAPDSRSRSLREQLGSFIFDIAATGIADCSVLRSQSVRHFRHSMGTGMMTEQALSVPLKHSPSNGSSH